MIGKNSKLKTIHNITRLTQCITACHETVARNVNNDYELSTVFKVKINNKLIMTKKTLYIKSIIFNDFAEDSNKHIPCGQNLVLIQALLLGQ